MVVAGICRSVATLFFAQWLVVDVNTVVRSITWDSASVVFQARLEAGSCVAGNNRLETGLP